MGKQAREREQKRLDWRRRNLSPFIDQILASPCFVEEDKRILRSVPVFHLQNLVKYIVQSWATRPFSLKDTPNLKLPFEYVFMEFKAYGIRQGFLFEELGEDDAEFHRFAPDYLREPTTMLRGVPYLTTTQANSLEVYIAVDERGNAIPAKLGRSFLYPMPIVAVVHDSPLSRLIDNQRETLRKVTDACAGAAVIACYGLSLLNCRNIVQVDGESHPDIAQEFEKEYRENIEKHHILALGSVGTKRAEDKPQQAFDVMPLHLRRGNFAHYTDAAPLFGKYTGTFWRPATVVGSERNGIVVKDYKVKADVEAQP
jgi:hypothetical protein